MRKVHSYTEAQLQAARNKIEEQGITIKEWSKKHGVSNSIVVNVLSGRLKGVYGQSHKVAVILGLKNGIVD